MTTTARRSVLVLGGRPLVLVDTTEEGRDGPLTRPGDPAVWSFVDIGLRLLPGFLGQALAVCPGLQLDDDDGLTFRLTDTGEDALHVPASEVDDAWRTACLHHGGCLLLLGRDVDLAHSASEVDVGAALDIAARGGRLVGGVVDLPGSDTTSNPDNPLGLPLTP